MHHGYKTAYTNYRDFLTSGYPWDRNFSRAAESFENFIFLTTPKSERWTDIESSLSLSLEQYVEKYIDAYHPRNRVNPCSPVYNEEMTSLSKKCACLKNNFMEEIYSFTGICFYDWLSNIDYSTAKGDLQFDNNSIFFNFNYTTTLEKLYGISPDQILHLQGCIENIEKEKLRIKHGSITEIRGPLVRFELQY